MADATKSVAVAMSFIDDVVARIPQLGNYEWLDRPVEPLHEALSLAEKELDKAKAQGEDVSLEYSRLHYTRGNVIFAMGDGSPNRGTFNSMMKNAAESYEKAIGCFPTPLAYYNLGMAYVNLNRNQEAVSALKKAEETAGEGDSVGLDASKALAKLEQTKGKSGGCYVATACYGSYEHPDVLVLRRFRDEQLMASVPGRLFVWSYYAVSPCLARRLARRGRLAGFIRHAVLEPLVRRWRDR